MDELSARRVVLARAIESADAQGQFLSEHERGQVDRDARRDAIRLTEGQGEIAPEQFLQMRAGRVLGAVGVRHPGVVALQEPASWPRWVAALTPLIALVVGVLTDAVGNAHRVDLVSLPLLGVVLWNVVMYVALAVGSLLPHRRPLLAGLGRWTDGEQALRRRPGNLRAQATAHFYREWFRLTEALHVERCKRVLHLSAAAWGVGVVLSLLVRGLVVEYRVGWESTFLGAPQVHAILSVLRLPALLVFPFEPFSVQEVASLQFSQGSGAAAGARWVYLYVALLLVVVIVPRLLLYAVAHWRERHISRHMALDLSEPYFQRIVSLLASTRVQLGLLTHRPEDRDALLRVLAQEAEPGPVLLTSDFGDVLRMVDLPLEPPTVPRPKEVPWWQRVLGSLGGPQPPARHGVHAPSLMREETDVVVHVMTREADVDAAQPVLQWLDKPVLRVLNAAVHPPGMAATLAFDAFARCWAQERAFLSSIGALLPAPKQAGFDRLAAAWNERNDARFRWSMGVVAEHLLYAARQVEEVHTGALTVRNLLPAEREVQTAARQTAMDAIVKRLDASAGEMWTRLRKLHRIDDDAGAELAHRLEEKFVVQQAIDTPQAGMAGAASGAAMGATVDLLVGGLTLGAATALGALVGGGAAYVAAAWRNRASPNGGTIVQLSDAMMQAMVEGALLRYLAVAHCARGVPQEGREDLDAGWKAEVVAAVNARAEMLPPFWSNARTQPNPSRIAQPLAHELESMVRAVFQKLYPVGQMGAKTGSTSAVSGQQSKA
jgi:hypothetical protein